MRTLIILALAGLLIALPAAIWMYGQKTTEAQVVTAITQGDVNALAGRVDFDKLRAFIKQDLHAKKNDKSPIGAVYANMGPSAANIDKVVDYYVQPDNIAILYYLYESTFENIPVDRFIVKRGFSPLYGFSMTFGLPPEAVQQTGAAQAAADRFQVRVVFRLSGLTWKVTELHVPLFMAPRHVYSQPAVQIFAPKSPVR